MTFDRIDLKILDILQHDATVPVARIADQVGLSQTPCWKRIQKHEETGVIRARVALLDPQAIGLSLTVFVMVEAVAHTTQWRAEFLCVVDTLGPVRDVYRLAGGHDFMLRVVVPDMAAFDRFYKDLTARIRLRSMNSVFALETMRTTTALPLGDLMAG
ncbi:Lrp/AsnC family transcriptional regulator [Rhodovulum imhoffii]|uniref:Lrp/AsnC family transcriptional regulator n=1 Tax=Rhodovulum imhoffii TaxID=365340 RepID=A0A2T5BWJ9_9RHOB|nr:Lrp/AsnC family transcriptional regulator [Rhodovulum imhoffii]MBK5935057.1 transcriptional regulator [Rhodovulum imhoffii]PTN03978.1 Lrp/AsnC family transcriptional regulator [Rhodovulum imhoffii]